VKGKRRLRTFLDKDFNHDWGETPRHLKDEGRYAMVKDGHYRQNNHLQQAIGAGRFSVRIGARTFSCVRVLDLEGAGSEKGTLVEAYVTEKGRTELFRRYNGRYWARKARCGVKAPWDEELPENNRLVIDDVMYVHWYDCLTSASIGWEKSD